MWSKRLEIMLLGCHVSIHQQQWRPWWHHSSAYTHTSLTVQRETTAVLWCKFPYRKFPWESVTFRESFVNRICILHTICASRSPNSCQQLSVLSFGLITNWLCRTTWGLQRCRHPMASPELLISSPTKIFCVCMCCVCTYMCVCVSCLCVCVCV